MQQYLIEHALENVWCNPDQDNQLRFAPSKITVAYGEINYFTLMGRECVLPTTVQRYHVYQVGQLQPLVAGLLDRTPAWTREKWYLFSDAMNALNLEVTIYTAKGALLPRYKSYFMFTKERALIFAIPIDPMFPVDYEAEAIYFRLYTNTYFTSDRAQAEANSINCKGFQPTTIAQVLDIQNQYTALRAKKGAIAGYINGRLVDSLTALTMNINDRVEWVYDSSVKKVITLNVSDLPMFESTLDAKYKYLIHSSLMDGTTIDYQDDIDVHVLWPGAFNKFSGFYYNRNNQDAHRMVTHRDYSIVVDYFNYIAQALEAANNLGPVDLEGFKIQLKIREAGQVRPLIFENQRIFELYKMPDADVVQALIGLNSTVPEWRCDVLEACGYTKLMRDTYSEVNITDIQLGYGYNGISKVVGDTPQKTLLNSGRQRATLPYGLKFASTVYEFDVDGHMLGYQINNSDTDYIAADNNCRLIEAFVGNATVTPDVVYGQSGITVPTYNNFRVYRCFRVDSIQTTPWIDITDDGDYTVSNGILTYTTPGTDYWLMVRSDATFLAYTFTEVETDGLLSFTLKEQGIRGPNGLETYVMPVPMGELDIWMNDNYLIRGLDYVINFPVIHITNKNHLVQPARTSSQKFHVKFSGFCLKDLTMDPVEEFGWVVNAALSNNNRYDVRDDKVLQISVGGGLRHRSDLIFYEDNPSVSMVNPLNGQPYQIKDIVVPLRQLVDENTYSLRAKSQEIDQRVSDYLTLKFGDIGPLVNSSITERYQLVSPFLNKFVDLFRNDQIELDPLVNYTDQQVLAICQPYEGLLAFDPLSDENAHDIRFSYVVPHRYATVVNLTLYQYRFMLRIVSLYAAGKVDITPFLTFST